MAVFSGPKIVNSDLTLAYDMDNTKKSWIGKPTTNAITPLTTQLFRYNNPGFSGASVDTGLTYKGMPIFELTFIPQDSSFVSRLSSGEGFGCFHTMGIPLLANTEYMASIYFRTDHPLSSSSGQGFNNTYSNIIGWGQNSTTSSRYQEDGWTRLYSQYKNNYNGYSLRPSGFQTNFTVNTTSTTTVDVTFTVPSNGAGLSDFGYLYAIIGANPAIISNGGLTGLSIVNHGLNTTDFQKLSWPSIIRLKSSDLPFNYHVRLSVPSTGGVNTTITLRANFDGYYTALTDNKYWKITFNTTNVISGQTLKTYWCCPMIEQHSTLYPSTFTSSSRSDTQALIDLTGKNIITANSLTYTSTGKFSFNGTSDYLRMPVNHSYLSPSCLEVVFKKNAVTGRKYLFGYRHNSGYSWPTIGSLYLIDNVLYASLITASQVYRQTASSQTINANEYYHVCFNKDTVNGVMEIYVNGVLRASQTFDTATYGQWSSPGQYVGADILEIGKSTNDNSGQGWGTDYFDGEIPVAKVYGRVLTANEISQNFEAIRGRYGI